MKRSVVKAVMVTVLLSSCSNVGDYFMENKKSPKVKLMVYGVQVSNEDNYRDTIKVNHDIEVEYEVVDEERPRDKINVYLSGETIENFYYSELYGKFIIGTDTEGLKRFEVVAKNDYGKVQVCGIDLVAIKNLPPVVKFYVRQVNELEIEVDATESFDRDQRFGGYIKLYKYDLNGYIFESYSNIVRYRFTQGGIKVIKVEVVDSDGVSSGELSTVINM